MIITPSGERLRTEDSKGDDYEKPVAHYSHFGGALKKITECQLHNGKENYTSVKDYLEKWDELNQKVIDRTKVRDAAGYGTTEWEELSALNGTDLGEMDVITGNVVDYKSDYDAWESVLLSLSNTSPGDRSIPGGGSIRSGRINQGEYNLKITDRQKDLLDKSVGATLDLAWNTVQVGGVMQAYMMEYEHTQGGELVQFDFRNQFSSVSRSEWEGYEIHMSIMQEQVTIPGAMEGDWDKRYESRNIFIIINRYGTQLLEEHGYNRETGQEHTQASFN